MPINEQQTVPSFGKFVLSQEGNAKVEVGAQCPPPLSSAKSAPSAFVIRRARTPRHEYERAIRSCHPSLQFACRRYIASLDYVVCGLYKSQKSIRRLRHQPFVAAQFPYIVPNAYGCCRYIVVDLDYRVFRAIQRQADLWIPLPTFWVESGTDSVHLYYELDSAWVGKGLIRARALGKRLARIWGADTPIYTSMAKNPLSHEWHLNPRMSSGTAYPLETLWTLAFEIDAPRKPLVMGDGRNTTMFRHLQLFAAEALLGRTRPKTVEELRELLRDEATRVIGDVRGLFPDRNAPYTALEAFDTCKSVAKKTFRMTKSELEKLLASAQRVDKRAARRIAHVKDLLRIGIRVFSGRSVRKCGRRANYLRKHGLTVKVGGPVTLIHTCKLGPLFWALVRNITLTHGGARVRLVAEERGLRVDVRRTETNQRRSTAQGGSVYSNGTWLLPWECLQESIKPSSYQVETQREEMGLGSQQSPKQLQLPLLFPHQEPEASGSGAAVVSREPEQSIRQEDVIPGPE